MKSFIFSPNICLASWVKTVIKTSWYYAHKSKVVVTQCGIFVVSYSWTKEAHIVFYKVSNILFFYYFRIRHSTQMNGLWVFLHSTNENYFNLQLAYVIYKSLNWTKMYLFICFFYVIYKENLVFLRISDPFRVNIKWTN